jgi:hypothetical protein
VAGIGVEVEIGPFFRVPGALETSEECNGGSKIAVGGRAVGSCELNTTEADRGKSRSQDPKRNFGRASEDVLHGSGIPQSNAIVVLEHSSQAKKAGFGQVFGIIFEIENRLDELNFG